MAITWHSPCHDPGSIPGIGENSFLLFFMFEHVCTTSHRHYAVIYKLHYAINLEHFYSI